VGTTADGVLKETGDAVTLNEPVGNANAGDSNAVSLVSFALADPVADETTGDGATL